MVGSVNVLQLLDSGNYQTYNREVARALKSVNAAILLSELINRYHYHESKGELVTYKKYDGEWFYYTIDRCENRTCLSPDEQKSALKILEVRGFFIKKAIGLPAKRHFQINIQNIIDFISCSKNVSRSGKIPELDRGKSQNWIGENPGANKEPYKKNPKEEEEEEEEEPPTSSLSILEKEKIKSRTDNEYFRLIDMQPDERKILIERGMVLSDVEWNNVCEAFDCRSKKSTISPVVPYFTTLINVKAEPNPSPEEVAEEKQKQENTLIKNGIAFATKEIKDIEFSKDCYMKVLDRCVRVKIGGSILNIGYLEGDFETLVTNYKKLVKEKLNENKRETV